MADVSFRHVSVGYALPMTPSQTSSRSSFSSWALQDEWLTTLLDNVEERLPTPADHLLGLQRAVTRLGMRVLSTAVQTVGSSMESVFSTGQTGVRTVTGQARSAVERTVETGKTGTKEVLGQAKAQTERTVASAESEVDGLADQLEASKPTRSFQDWTRADLYSRAQELQIEGCSGMNKADLIKALLAHDTV